VKRIQRRFEVYEEIQTRVEKLDPSIGQAIEDAIKQLERREEPVRSRKKVDEQFPKSLSCRLLDGQPASHLPGSRLSWYRISALALVSRGGFVTDGFTTA